MLVTRLAGPVCCWRYPMSCALPGKHMTCSGGCARAAHLSVTLCWAATSCRQPTSVPSTDARVALAGRLEAALLQAGLLGKLRRFKTG